MNLDHRLTEIIEGMSDIFFSLAPDWTILHGNSHFFSYSNVKPEDQIGKNFLELYLYYPGAEASNYWVNYHRAMRERVSVSFEDYFPPLDKWTLVNARPNSLGGLDVFVRDITDSKRVELVGGRLQDTLEQNALIMKAVKIGTYELDVRTNSVVSSSNLDAVYGFEDSVEERPFSSFAERIHPEDAAEVDERIRASVINKSLFEHEHRILLPSGEVRWIMARGAPTFAEDGSVATQRGITLDVTNHKKPEGQLLGVLESMSDAFFSVDKNWIITRVNEQHLKSTHFKREEQIGKNLLELFFSRPEAKESQYWKKYHEVMEQRVPVQFEEYYPPFDLWTLVKANPTEDGGMAVFFTDTTVQKRILQQIEAEKQKFEAVFFDSPASMALLRGPTFIFEQVNEKYVALLGGRDLKGKTLHDALPELIGQPFHDLMKQVYETGKTYIGKETFAKLIRRPGGEPEDTFLDFTYSRIDDGTGKPYGIYIHASDITEMVLSRRQVEESKRKLQLALQAGHMGTWHTDLRTNIVTLSPEAKALFQIEDESINVPQLINQMMHPEDREQVSTVLSMAIATKTPYSHEYRIIRTDGEVRWLLAQGNFVDESDGKAYHSGVVQDITERKKAEERIKEISFEAQNFRQTLHDVFMQSSAAIAICHGRDFVFELANIPYQEIVAKSEAQLIGKGIAEAIPELERTVIQAFQNVYDTGEPFIVTELPATIAHGGVPTLGYYNLTVNPVYDSQGEVQRAVIIGYDVSEQVEARRKAEVLLRDLEDAVSARDEFLSIASHELKTPLTSLKLQAQLHSRAVKRQDPRAYEPERVDELVDQTERQVNRLTRLVDDMLDVSRIRTGQLTIQREPFDLVQMTEEVLKRLKTQFTDAGYALPTVIHSGDTEGDWDKMRIEQVLTNLLTNAIRYGKKNPVKISVEAMAEAVRIKVQDHGIGIGPEATPIIFDRFERAINANEVSGLGLGLFITKQIVVAHGGKVWVESEAGKGSEFIVVLPKRSGATISQE